MIRPSYRLAREACLVGREARRRGILELIGTPQAGRPVHWQARGGVRLVQKRLRYTPALARSKSVCSSGSSLALEANWR